MAMVDVWVERNRPELLGESLTDGQWLLRRRILMEVGLIRYAQSRKEIEEWGVIENLGERVGIEDMESCLVNGCLARMSWIMPLSQLDEVAVFGLKPDKWVYYGVEL